MTYDFDTVLDRRGRGACKFLGIADDIVPMSIADMDFASPPEVQEALRRRAEFGNYGYTVMVDEDYQAIIDFVKWRHGVDIPREHLLATPGVLYTMRCAMYMLTQPGDKVVVSLPLHTPSIRTASLQGRIPLHNWMKRNSEGNYTFDLEDMERHFQAGAKVLLMCSPHNPTGRVWTKAELEGIAQLAQAYEVTVVADEVHRDLTYTGHPHVSIGELPGMAERTITVFSASKTFNFGGFHIGTAVVPREDYKQRLRAKLYEIGHACGRPPLFSIVAQTTAYQKGRTWLKELIAVLEHNADLCIRSLEGLPVKVFRPEASFILWVDCSELKLDTAGLNALMQEARLTADPGHYYDMWEIGGYTGPQHHFRLTFGMPQSVLEPAMERLRECILQLPRR